MNDNDCLLLYSEVGGLIQEINKLQSETDTLDEINEALRSRLGMGPGEEPDLTEVCNYCYQLIISLTVGKGEKIC